MKLGPCESTLCPYIWQHLAPPGHAWCPRALLHMSDQPGNNKAHRGYKKRQQVTIRPVKGTGCLTRHTQEPTAIPMAGQSWAEGFILYSHSAACLFKSLGDFLVLIRSTNRPFFFLILSEKHQRDELHKAPLYSCQKTHPRTQLYCCLDSTPRLEAAKVPDYSANILVLYLKRRQHARMASSTCNHFTT